MEVDNPVAEIAVEMQPVAETPVEAAAKNTVKEHVESPSKDDSADAMEIDNPVAVTAVIKTPVATNATTSKHARDLDNRGTNVPKRRKKGYVSSSFQQALCDHSDVLSFKREDNGGCCKNGYSLDGVCCVSCKMPFVGSKPKPGEWHVCSREGKVDKETHKKSKGAAFHCPQVYECGIALCGNCYGENLASGTSADEKED